jgi:hypothetical protein
VKRIVSIATAAGSVMAAAATALWLAVPAGASSSAVTGTENFQIMTTSATSSTASVIAAGVFTAGGVDHQGNKVDTFVFSNGTLKVAHMGPSTAHMNPRTCLLTIVGHGTFKITGGTGAYSKTTGAGTYKLNILAVAARNAAGKCSQKAPPTAFQQVVKASGKVSM